MSSNPLIADINEGLKECAGVQVAGDSIFLANSVVKQPLKIVGFWLQHLRYVVGVTEDKTIYAINGVARQVATKMGWEELKADRPIEYTTGMDPVIPGILTLIQIGMTMAGDNDPHDIDEGDRL